MPCSERGINVKQQKQPRNHIGSSLQQQLVTSQTEHDKTVVSPSPSAMPKTAALASSDRAASSAGSTSALQSAKSFANKRCKTGTPTVDSIDQNLDPLHKAHRELIQLQSKESNRAKKRMKKRRKQVMKSAKNKIHADKVSRILLPSLLGNTFQIKTQTLNPNSSY